jgi:hypothetical protein
MLRAAQLFRDGAGCLCFTARLYEDRHPCSHVVRGGFGLGVEVTTDLGQLSVPSSVGQFGWYGAATTCCQIDPKERIVAIAFAQHFPFNEHNFFAAFQTAYYQALK